MGSENLEKRMTKIGIALVGGTLILIGMIGSVVQAHAQEDEPRPAQCPGLSSTRYASL